jgi:PAS domain S-box-containing protein
MDMWFAEALIANMPDAVVYADREGTILYWNGGAGRIFGYTAAEAVGQSLDLIIPEGLRERHWVGYRATMRTGRTRYGDGQTLSVPAIRKDGKRISVAFTIVPFVDDKDALIGIAAVMRDVSAQFEETRVLRREIETLWERGRLAS